MDVISCVEASAEGAVAVDVTSLDVTRLVASDVMVESIAEDTDETMEDVTSSSVEEGMVVCAELEMLDVVIVELDMAAGRQSPFTVQEVAS